MRAIRLFKRTHQQWIERPTGGRHLIPEPERVREWLKSDFARKLVNKSVGGQQT
jgi:hypothetical protein